MRNIACITLVLLVICLGAIAQDTNTDTQATKPHLITEYHLPGFDKRISLDVVDSMELVELIRYLGLKADLNVIIGREVTGTTKFFLKDVTVGEALEIVLAANDLAYEVQGNIIKIMTDKSYRELHGEGFYERKQTKVIELRYAMPSRVADLLKEIKSSIGSIVFDDGTGNIVLIDTPQKIQEMEAIIRKTEIPSIQRVMPTVTTNFLLQYAKIEDVEPKLVPLLTKDVGHVQSDKRTKTLIVTELPSSIQKIVDVVALFDRPQQQVFIEAKIVEVQLTEDFRLGVNWNHVLEGLDPRFSLATVSSFPVAGPGSLTYHTIAAGGDLNVVVNALASTGNARVLSNPHIAVTDGDEATIKVITSQPYAETTFESGTTNITGKTYKFIDVGVTLVVTPRINELGFITMKIRPEVSTLLPQFYDDASGTGLQGVPVVKKSVAETMISVKDGVTIIIAGMIDEHKSKTITRVPVLGSIPLLGLLFRSEITTVQNTETVVLLTPRIVTGAKFFERAKDMKRPTKSDDASDPSLVGAEMTP